MRTNKHSTSLNSSRKVVGHISVLMAWINFTALALPCFAAPANPSVVSEADPTKAEVPLPASAGWGASLVLDNKGVGIWTVEAFQVFPQTAPLEIVGLDDIGRVHICSGYSGKWTPVTVVSDGKWLGGLAHADVDPRIKGTELYVGSQQGNLYQIVAWPHSVVDYRLIAHIPGREIHSIVGGLHDPAHPGPNLLVFTRPGGVFRVTPTGSHGTFEFHPASDYDGRIRQAIPLPGANGENGALVTVSHNGRIELLRLTIDGFDWQTIFKTTSGVGRVALRPRDPDQPHRPDVLYTTVDDGRILRHEQQTSGSWTTTTIYAGDQGPRGVVSGPFGLSPDDETIAIFGYNRRVELLTRMGEEWTAETIFEDLDKGHWLAAAELDGRNDTAELVTAGYSGRMVVLSRPPVP